MIEKFEANITQFGDDALLVRVKPKELKIKLSEYTLSLSEFLIRSEEFWVDIIPAEESLAVKFNPFEISAVNAHKKLEKIINAFNFEESIQRYNVASIDHGEQARFQKVDGKMVLQTRKIGSGEGGWDTRKDLEEFSKESNARQIEILEKA